MERGTGKWDREEVEHGRFPMVCVGDDMGAAKPRRRIWYTGEWKDVRPPPQRLPPHSAGTTPRPPPKAPVTRSPRPCHTHVPAPSDTNVACVLLARGRCNPPEPQTPAPRTSLYQSLQPLSTP